MPRCAGPTQHGSAVCGALRPFQRGPARLCALSSAALLRPFQRGSGLMRAPLFLCPLKRVVSVTSPASLSYAPASPTPLRGLRLSPAYRPGCTLCVVESFWRGRPQSRARACCRAPPLLSTCQGSAPGSAVAVGLCPVSRRRSSNPPSFRRSPAPRRRPRAASGRPAFGLLAVGWAEALRLLKERGWKFSEKRI